MVDSCARIGLDCYLLSEDDPAIRDDLDRCRQRLRDIESGRDWKKVRVSDASECAWVRIHVSDGTSPVPPRSRILTGNV